ncbi:hypothetical protein LCGC14_2736250, partial [marine sediment metagenome]
EELFFIRDRVDMNRSKEVEHFQLTVYRDFEEGKPYRGSVSLRLYPGSTEAEMEQTIDNGAFAAGLVRNEPFPLVHPSVSTREPPARPPPRQDAPGHVGPGQAAPGQTASRFAEKDLRHWLKPLSETLYSNAGEGINSAELFLDRIETRIMNSAGVDVSFTRYRGAIDLITECQGDKEEVELSKFIEFSDFVPDRIVRLRDQQLRLCRDRAVAAATPSMESAVMLTGEPVKEFFQYYLAQSSAESAYKGLSILKPGQSAQGAEIRGDLFTLSLDPDLPNSTYSSPWDLDGYPLKKTAVIDRGRLLNFWGPLRFCHYLGIKPSGSIGNVVVEGGSRPMATLRQGPCLEVVSFSDFQTNPLTGDFGGEIRLAYLSKDGSRDRGLPVSGGSISGNILNVQGEMTLSRERQ